MKSFETAFTFARFATASQSRIAGPHPRFSSAGGLRITVFTAIVDYPRFMSTHSSFVAKQST